MKNVKLFSILFIALLAFNCSKDKNDDRPDITDPDTLVIIQQLLMDGKWYLVPATNDDITVYNCRKKTSYHFKAEDILIHERFSINTSEECVSSGEQTQTYKLKNDGSHLEITNGSNTILYTIELLTEQKLIINNIYLANGPMITYKR